MSFQAQKFQNRDIFSVQPLPKSFYHPSPSKQVDEREAIRSPQKKSEPRSKCAQEEEEFLRGNMTYKMSALPSAKTLSEAAEKWTENGQRDETWPDGERPTFESFSGDSIATYPEDSSALDSPPTKVADLAKGLEGFKYPQISADIASKGMAPSNYAGGSVLQSYVERFRNSAPRSREERMKEKGDNQQFWWLQTSPGSRAGSEAAEYETVKNLRQIQKIPEVGTKQQLTKDALQALDEETIQLQNKADMLLSKSLASSSPIVSTEGLGTSTSISDYSLRDDQMPYRPAFLQTEEKYFRSEMNQKQHSRQDMPLSANVVSKHPTNDILIQWRLRRKIEEATAVSHVGRAPSQKHQHNLGLDSRLEEFRKKILSQRALVTHEDIQYERQKMSMIMDDAQQDDIVSNRNETAVRNADSTKDAVLERMQKITHGRIQETTAANGDIRQTPGQKGFPTSMSFITGSNNNFSTDNTNVSDTITSGHILTSPTLNKNNTALRYQPVSQNVNKNSIFEHGFSVDSFQSQVVCDPKQQRFYLGNSKIVSCNGGSVHAGIPENLHGHDSGTKKTYLKDPMPQQISTESINLNKAPDLSSHLRVNKVGTGMGVFETRCSENSADKSGALTESHESSVQMSSTNEVGAGHDHHDVEESKNSYCQFLEAEKPISEPKRHVVGNENTRMPNLKDSDQDNRKNTVTLKAAMKNERQADKTGVSADKSQAKGHDKRKLRLKSSKKDRGGEYDKRGRVLSDVTNENEPRTEKIEEMPRIPVSRHRSDLSNSQAQSHENRKTVRYPDQLNNKVSLIEEVTRQSQKQHSTPHISSSQKHQPIQYAIGQTVVEHLFESSCLASSVDSWESMFPQSPGLSHSFQGSGHSLTELTPARRGSTPLQSTPINKGTSDQGISDEEYHSDGEFFEDPLLQILRQQRNHYLQKLELIEKKIQAMDF